VSWQIARELMETSEYRPAYSAIASPPARTRIQSIECGDPAATEELCHIFHQFSKLSFLDFSKV
jgi:hypothetical protein